MPRARKEIINLHDTIYYHCVSRCVRRAFLCGQDKYTGQSYEHRREWVEKRLAFLSTVFSIEICAYAVMSNHTHVVLRVNKDKAIQWSNEEVLQRWHELFNGTLLTRTYLDPLNNQNMSKAENLAVASTVNIYRNRLFDISWFMRLLNEYIARKANEEDHCKGRFWEGRFKSQALLDETSILTCMAYVDLNPLRAKIAKDLNSSKYTSIFRRIEAANLHTQPIELVPLTGYNIDNEIKPLPFSINDYLLLLEQTSNYTKTSCPKTMSFKARKIIRLAGFTVEQWQGVTKNFEGIFGSKVSKKSLPKSAGYFKHQMKLSY